MKALKVLGCSEKYKYQGPRFIRFGPESGQEFREGYLIPWLKENRCRDDELAVDFTGTQVFSPSFLEECFVGAIRKGHTEIKQIHFLNIPAPEYYFIKSLIESAVSPAEKNLPKKQPPVYKCLYGHTEAGINIMGPREEIEAIPRDELSLSPSWTVFWASILSSIFISAIVCCVALAIL